MLVKIVCGTYGYRDENGILCPKNSGSEPFELEEREADRLIRAGMAQKMWDEPEEKTREENADEQEAEGIDREQLNGMDKKELVQMAEEMGLKSTGTKENLIERIMEAVDMESGEAGDEMPELKPAEPEM